MLAAGPVLVFLWSPLCNRCPVAACFPAHMTVFSQCQSVPESPPLDPLTAGINFIFVSETLKGQQTNGAAQMGHSQTQQGSLCHFSQCL